MIHINKKALEKMITDATTTYPDECCGFLFGNETGELRQVEDACAVVNSKEGDKRRRFSISSKDYMDAEKYALENNLAFLGIYHSHPEHPAIPSEHDRKAAQPYFSYIILSVMQGKYAAIRSWRLNEERQFEEETISEQQYSTNN